MAQKHHPNKTFEKVFIALGGILVVVLLVIGSLAWYGYTFATNSVHDELVSQKIFFPEAGSAGFTAEEYPTLQQYGGQQVDSGVKAKAYANEYIGHHLTKIAGGKTYSEVSALAMVDPTNTTLASQKATLFQGETLRGLLLGDGYSFWLFGQIGMYVALASFAGAAILLVVSTLGWIHLRRV